MAFCLSSNESRFVVVGSCAFVEWEGMDPRRQPSLRCGDLLLVSGAYIELLLLLPLLLLPLLLLLCTGLSPMAVEAVCNKISR